MNSSSLEGSEVVLIHGYPGSGKGTQCALLKEYFGFNHLSVGDLLIKEMETNSKPGTKIKSYVIEGKILPMEDTLEVLKKAMKKSEQNHFLLDGYPRDKANLDAWIKFTTELDIKVKCVLRLNCDKEICKDRLLKNEVSNRIDNNEKAVKERLEAYEGLMGPIHEFYKDIRKEVDGQGVKGNDTPEQVFERVLKVVEGEGPQWFPSRGAVKDMVKKIKEESSTTRNYLSNNADGESDKHTSSSENRANTIKTLTASSSSQLPSSLKGCVVVLVHGYPGAGKGTQCELLEKSFAFTHISVGELMRKEMKRENIASMVIRSYVLEGKIVPAKFTCKILKQVMEDSKARQFLIDGYPRDERNLKAWIEFVKENNISVKFVLLLNCIKETCRRRILGNVTGRGRKDDNPVTLERRFEAYENLMDPIHEYYRSIRREVDGQGETTFDSPTQVFERVRDVFQREGFEVSSPPEKESLEKTKKISRTNMTEPDWVKHHFKRKFKK